MYFPRSLEVVELASSTNKWKYNANLRDGMADKLQGGHIMEITGYLLGRVTIMIMASRSWQWEVTSPG